MRGKAEILETVRKYVLEEFLPDEDPAALTDDTPLLTTGILDSVATLKLITFLEDEFRVEIRASEADPENIDTLALITALVASKG